MAVITRIDVVNYLCEGWQPSMGHARWTPLWPANTLVLRGLSTAIQIPNGCGKTSMANAILFVLSRDRELKREFLSRCAPAEAGYSHVRIEFAMRDEDLSQRNLMAPEAIDFPAKSYVIGICANRGDEDLLFYRYAGTLETAPAYRMEGTKIAFTPNDEFRRQIAKSDWHRGTIADWSKVVSEFMSPEVVRQNVLFHRSGAGDASATFKKVVTEPGERFDEAYFRIVAAPQLLANLMGDSAEEGERTIEDTITISMTRFIDAKLKVERKQSYLQQREIMEAEFTPVVSAATAIQEAQSAYQHQLQTLACDAAFFEYFTAQAETSLPGIPRDASTPQVDQEVRQCLAGMALDKDGCIVVIDSAISQLVAKTTGHLNELAGRRSANRGPISTHPTSSQLIDFDCDSKFSGDYGGRRNQVRFYDRDAARELVERCLTEGQPHQKNKLEQAFDVAAQVLDTNPFRREQRRLSKRIEGLKNEIATVTAEGKAAEVHRAALESQVTQRAENHAAFQEFCAQTAVLPESLRSCPLKAKTWVARESEERQSNLIAHCQLAAKLAEGWDAFLCWTHELGLQTPSERLAELVSQRDRLKTAIVEAQDTRKTKQTNMLKIMTNHSELKTELTELQHQQSNLSPLLDLDQQFRQLFGDVDALSISPPVDERNQLQADIRPKAEALESKKIIHQKMSVLRVAHHQFTALFGDQDPLTVRPKDEWDNLVNSKYEAEKRLLAHMRLADALSKHLSEQGVEPSEWLRNTDEERVVAQRSVYFASQEIRRLEHEIAALDDLSVIHEIRFEKALNHLNAVGIDYEPLRDVILTVENSKTGCQALLSAFGSMLEAPVIEDLTMVERALAELKTIDSDLPVILRQPLLEALHNIDLHATINGGSVAFIAGATTRRIQALTDPDALKKIKTELMFKCTQLEDIREAAETRITACNPQSNAYRQALVAQTAIQEHSLAEVAAAEHQLKELAPKLVRAEQLITDVALQTLAQAIEYVLQGADDALDTAAKEIAALVGELETLESRIKIMETLTSPEAIRAHDGAVKLALAGGKALYDGLEPRIKQKKVEVMQHQDELKYLEKECHAAEQHCSDVSQNYQHFRDDIEPKIAELKEVIEFELAGHVSFMEANEETERSLRAARVALQPLERVNFERAQHYKDHQNDDDTELQKLCLFNSGYRFCTMAYIMESFPTPICMLGRQVFILGLVIRTVP